MSFFLQDIIKTIAYLQATLIMFNNNTSSSEEDTVTDALITKLLRTIIGNMNLTSSSLQKLMYIKSILTKHYVTWIWAVSKPFLFFLDTVFLLKVVINNFYFSLTINRSRMHFVVFVFKWFKRIWQFNST